MKSYLLWDVFWKKALTIVFLSEENVWRLLTSKDFRLRIFIKTRERGTSLINDVCWFVSYSIIYFTYLLFHGVLGDSLFNVQSKENIFCTLLESLCTVQKVCPAIEMFIALMYFCIGTYGPDLERSNIETLNVFPYCFIIWLVTVRREAYF